jgi:glycosyltransferase involved in cell wall biosynthesis
MTRQLVKAGWQIEPGRILEQRQRHSLSDGNLQTVLWKAGFSDVFLSHHVREEDRISAQGWLKEQALAFGRKAELRRVPRLSVVVPVFNEAGTVRQILDALEAKQIPGVEIEIIVVESASTDGSRDAVLAYRDRPRFRVVLEERPRGKGHAVRTGLRHVTGDIVLIQDADLEYDFLDYEMLISPILRGRAAFVLGTRHAGHWKIRKFAQHWLADMMNLAHWGLVYAMNRMYGQSMTDPFTMFKVFRADCLSGLEFECNRFDFDVELVCKLLRKGYSPLEVPVNYQARSFEEGKKVRIFRDPLTWVRAMLKYRSSPVHTMPAPTVRSEAPAPPSCAVAT